jgi:hypothetical protein
LQIVLKTTVRLLLASLAFSIWFCVLRGLRMWAFQLSLPSPPPSFFAFWNLRQSEVMVKVTPLNKVVKSLSKYNNNKVASRNNVMMMR